MPRKCVVERIWDTLDHSDRVTLKYLIEEPRFTAGYIAKLLIAAGHTGADRAAIGHYRRKLLAGKATL